jgi:hypothetical protein
LIAKLRAGTVLEALVDRQDDQLAGAAEPALHHDAGQIGLHAGIVGFVFGQDLFDDGGEAHRVTPGSDLLSGLLKRRDARQVLAFHPFQEGAAGG